MSRRLALLSLAQLALLYSHQSSRVMLVYVLLNRLDHLLTQLGDGLNRLFLLNPWRDVRYVRLQLEPCEIWHVVEWYLLNLKEEPACPGVAAKRLLAQALAFVDLELANVALFLQILLYI